MGDRVGDGRAGVRHRERAPGGPADVGAQLGEHGLVRREPRTMSVSIHEKNAIPTSTPRWETSIRSTLSRCSKPALLDA